MFIDNRVFLPFRKCPEMVKTNFLYTIAFSKTNYYADDSFENVYPFNYLEN